MNAPIAFRELAAHEAAIARIQRLLAEQTPLICAYSGGRDSSVLVALTFEAALRQRALGTAPPPIAVVSVDTTIENPMVDEVRHVELARMRQFADYHGLTFEAHVAKPNLNDTWAVSILSGRRLPTFENTPRD